MRKVEVLHSLFLLEKIINSEKGIEIAHKYSEDITFKLGKHQSIYYVDNISSHKEYEIVIVIDNPKKNVKKINWKTTPIKKNIEKDLSLLLNLVNLPENIYINLQNI